MFFPGQRVIEEDTGHVGTVTSSDSEYTRVVFDDSQQIVMNVAASTLAHAEPLPGPSRSPDIVHAAMLRHAVNAGAAVTALEIIRREARRALTADTPVGADAWRENFAYIEKFADDVLSQVLPA